MTSSCFRTLFPPNLRFLRNHCLWILHPTLIHTHCWDIQDLPHLHHLTHVTLHQLLLLPGETTDAFFSVILYNRQEMKYCLWKSVIDQILFLCTDLSLIRLYGDSSTLGNPTLLPKYSQEGNAGPAANLWIALFLLFFLSCVMVKKIIVIKTR